VSGSVLREETVNKSSPDEVLLPIYKQNLTKIANSQTIEALRNKTRETALIITYSAAAVGSSTYLLLIPNLETITLFIFLVSMCYGYRIGFQMMLTTAIIFEFFATAIYGAGGWLIFFKIFAYSFSVLIGGFLKNRLIFLTNRNFLQRPSNNNNLLVFFFFLGYFLTLFYDIITMLSYLLIFPSFYVFLVTFIAGIPWYLFHELTNASLFMLIPKLATIITVMDDIRPYQKKSSLIMGY
jgi:hypothetical protein